MIPIRLEKLSLECSFLAINLIARAAWPSLRVGETRRCFCVERRSSARDIVCWCQVATWKLEAYKFSDLCCVWDCLAALLPYFPRLVLADLRRISNKFIYMLQHPKYPIQSLREASKANNTTQYRLRPRKKLPNKNNSKCHSAERCANKQINWNLHDSMAKAIKFLFGWR